MRDRLSPTDERPLLPLLHDGEPLPVEVRRPADVGARRSEGAGVSLALLALLLLVLLVGLGLVVLAAGARAAAAALPAALLPVALAALLAAILVLVTVLVALFAVALVLARLANAGTMKRQTRQQHTARFEPEAAKTGSGTRLTNLSKSSSAEAARAAGILLPLRASGTPRILASARIRAADTDRRFCSLRHRVKPTHFVSAHHQERQRAAATGRHLLNGSGRFEQTEQRGLLHRRHLCTKQNGMLRTSQRLRKEWTSSRCLSRGGTGLAAENVCTRNHTIEWQAVQTPKASKSESVPRTGTRWRRTV